jgi:preprotein translocase subunit SecG
MLTLLTVVYVVVCAALIISVLLQSSKGEGLAGAFGGGGLSGAVFGGRGAASFLSKATTVLAIMFMTLAVMLSFMGPGASSPAGVSAVQKASQQSQQSVPATDVPGTEPATHPATGQPNQSAQPAQQTAPPTNDSGGH